MFSNSWGGSYTYDAYSIEIDTYLYVHDDVVILYAAGNNGRYGKGTVISPSLAKNAVSVGTLIYVTCVLDHISLY